MQGEGDVDPVALREIAERTLSPRLERVNGVAAVTVQGGLRRQIRVDLSKEKITALGPAGRPHRQVLRTENQNIPVGEINEGDAHVPACAARASSTTSTRSATSWC